MKIYEWQAVFHGRSKAMVIRMIDVGATVAIAQEIVGTERIVIRAVWGARDR